MNDPVSGRFDPSTMNGPSAFWIGDVVSAILDHQERENATRDDFRPAIKRETVERAIGQLFALYECRASDFSAAYGWAGLWSALGVDWAAGIPFLLPEPTTEQPPAPQSTD